MSDKQHREDTKYLQWQEDSLRNGVYYEGGKLCFIPVWEESQLGVFNGDAGTWHSVEGIKLTRAQALYIATGETTI